MALRSFLLKLRSPTAEDLSALRLYRQHAADLVARVRSIRDEWVAMREVEPNFERLANTAAVNRWELLRMCKEVEHLDPPRMVNGVHRGLYDVIGDSARACQLLANGYRFHKSEAVCDGQALLVESVDELDVLLRELDGSLFR
jgi:hypothetical protein